jgi:hypothetical protein
MCCRGLRQRRSRRTRSSIRSHLLNLVGIQKRASIHRKESRTKCQYPTRRLPLARRTIPNLPPKMSWWAAPLVRYVALWRSGPSNAPAVKTRRWSAPRFPSSTSSGSSSTATNGSSTLNSRFCCKPDSVKLLERNILDPDVIVLGGGLSNILKLYAALPILDQRAAAKQSEKWVHTFSDAVNTPSQNPRVVGGFILSATVRCSQHRALRSNHRDARARMALAS